MLKKEFIQEFPELQTEHTPNINMRFVSGYTLLDEI